MQRESTSSAVLLATLRLERASNMAEVRLVLFCNRDLQGMRARIHMTYKNKFSFSMCYPSPVSSVGRAWDS